MNKISLNGKWKFTKEQITPKDLNTVPWEEVTVPHTWNGIDGQDGGNDYYRGLCWYNRTFDAKIGKGRIFIEFEGVNSLATVLINGIKVGTHKGGYSTFRFDVTDFIKEGENSLLVGADNKHYSDVFPLLADFTFYGGIYRNVYLVYIDDLSFDLTDDGTSGIYISQTNITDKFATFEVKSLIKNYGFSTNAKLQITLLDDSKETLLEIFEDLTINDNHTNISVLTLNNPHLWNSIEDPYLYSVEIKLFKNNELTDSRTIKTGFRYFEFDKTNFKLNGKITTLNGVCRHQDRWEIGNALTTSMHDEDMKYIKEIGANSLRLAHYQQADYFYDLCDKEGMVTWAEIPYITIPSKTDHEGTNALSQITELIKQNYNHSSIIMWGVQNELTAAGKRDNLENIVQKLHDLSKKLDPYRVTTQAQIASQPKKDSMNEITDLLGFNQYFGWYFGKVKDLKSWLSSYREQNPELPLCLSEYGVEGIIRYHTDEPKTKDYTEEYHAQWHEETYKILSETDFIWGTYVWNMFSFAADFRDEGGVKGINNKGLMTIDRKVKKDAFYYYKAKWVKEPLLHLTSKRFIERHNKDITLKAYSNLGEVSFYLNGELIERVKNSDVIFTCKVTLKDGENTVKVTSENLTDETVFTTVLKMNPSYKVPPKEKGKGLIALIEEHNWIDSQVETDEPIIVDKAFYSTDDKIGVLIKNKEAEKVLRKYLRPLFKHDMFETLKGWTVMAIHEYDAAAMPLGLVVKVNKELQLVKK